MTELALLIPAREDYRERGYAVGLVVDNKGNRCAVGSLICTACSAGGRASYDSALHRLNTAAFQRYDKCVVAVNDTPELGHNAVLDCYDAAIKECEEERKT